MTILTLETLATEIKPGRTIAGLDLGTKTIGFAVSDLGWRLANPKLVIARAKFTKDAEELLKAATKFEVGALDFVR